MFERRFLTLFILECLPSTLEHALNSLHTNIKRDLTQLRIIMPRVVTIQFIFLHGRLSTNRLFQWIHLKACLEKRSLMDEICVFNYCLRKCLSKRLYRFENETLIYTNCHLCICEIA